MIQTEARGCCEVSRGVSSISNHDDRLAENGAIAQIGKGLRRISEAVLFVNHRFQFADRRPIERRDHIGAVSSITPDQALLFHKKWPKIHLHITTGGGAASNHGAAA